MFHHDRLFMILLTVVLFSVALSWPAPEEVSWVREFETALKQAAAENKFLVVDISATWCGPCRDMERRVFPDPDFVEFSRDNVFMLVQSDRDREGARLARRFNVHAFPTILVFSSKGQEVGRLLGGRNATKLISDLEKIFSHYPNPAKQVAETLRPPEPAVPKAPEAPARPGTPVQQAVAAAETRPDGKQPPPQPVPPKPQDDDQIARLEKRLVAAEESERDWLNLMLGMAHFQAQHWKEAQDYLVKVLQKNPQNTSALEMMRVIEKYLRPPH